MSLVVELVSSQSQRFGVNIILPYAVQEVRQISELGRVGETKTESYPLI